jgi:hypothetical protein
VVVIARGKLVAAGTMDELASKRRSAGLNVVVRGNLDKALSVLRGVDGIAKASLARTAREASAQTPTNDVDDGSVHALRCSWSKKLDESATSHTTELAIAALVSAGLFIREASPLKSSLEELFGELTGASSAEADDLATDSRAAS